MQEICVDRKEFKIVREMGGVYVDKTKHIYNIFGHGLYFFLARPRRFGKSLLCTTLIELFKGNREVFKGLWIDASDWKWQAYPVIHLDMSKAASKNGTVGTMHEGMFNLLRQNAEALGITALGGSTPSLMLSNLIEKAYKHTGQKVVVIIDEYDKPILDVIDNQTQRSEIHAALSDFYSQLKPAENWLQFVFITGVFKFTKTSIFSNFNNLNDITFSSKTADIVGYTEEEIKLFFAEHLAALAQKAQIPAEAMMSRLRSQYNGYIFGIDTLASKMSESVYNSYALNYVFAEQELLDKWFESGTPGMLIKKLAEEDFKALKPEHLCLYFEKLNSSCTPDNINALSLLYYAGYVTMQACSTDLTGAKPLTSVQLGFPNINVAFAFTQELLPAILDKPIDGINQLAIKIRNALRDEQLDNLCKLLNDTLNPYAYPVLSQSYDPVPRENLYQIIFAGMFIAGNMRTTMEHMSNRGRIDLTVELTAAVYIFEIKLDESAAVAIKQIKDTDYGAKFRHQGKKIYAVGVSVSSEKRFVQELVWEVL